MALARTRVPRYYVRPHPLHVLRTRDDVSVSLRDLADLLSIGLATRQPYRAQPSQQVFWYLACALSGMFM